MKTVIFEEYTNSFNNEEPYITDSIVNKHSKKYKLKVRYGEKIENGAFVINGTQCIVNFRKLNNENVLTVIPDITMLNSKENKWVYTTRKPIAMKNHIFLWDYNKNIWIDILDTKEFKELKEKYNKFQKAHQSRWQTSCNELNDLGFDKSEIRYITNNLKGNKSRDFIKVYKHLCTNKVPIWLLNKVLSKANAKKYFNDVLKEYNIECRYVESGKLAIKYYKKKQFNLLK